MTTLRVGTRASDLALCQTEWVCTELQRLDSNVGFEQVRIRTTGDRTRAQGAQLEPGIFVKTIEQGLLDGRIDLAVHSLKDMPTEPTPGLCIAAVPVREVAHDVLISREPVDLDGIPAGFRIGTGSPRRAAQIRRLGEVAIVPIRGNVPTRLKKLETENLDAIVLAAAGLRRLKIDPEHCQALSLDRFPPAPGQGALAVQVREGDPQSALIQALDHLPTRVATAVERDFLREVGGGCGIALGALGQHEGGRTRLFGQLFGEGGTVVEGREESEDSARLGASLAVRLLAEMRS